MSRQVLIISVLIACLTGCSPKQQPQKKPSTTTKELQSMIGGLKAYTPTTNFILRSSLIANLTILATNEIVSGTNYSYRVQFLYPMEQGAKRRILADVPFEVMNKEAMNDGQWYDKVIILEIE